jgi:AraC-like DNA-binding protein
MHYQTLAPEPHLAPFVDCYWLLEAPAPPAAAEPEIVLPDGKTELIVHFGDDFLKLEGETYTRQARVLMSGQLTERILLRPTGAIGVVAARFRAAGAARFFRVPYEEIVDEVVDFARFFPDVAASLHDEVARAPTHDARLGALTGLLERRLSAEPPDDLFVRQACQYITRSEGEYTVAELVKLIGFSERQLERKFKKQVGITPKILARIMRFQKFLALAQTTPDLTLSDAAHACGYYDQSHFIRDFTRFSGVSPLRYLGSAHAMSDHFTKPQ